MRAALASMPHRALWRWHAATLCGSAWTIGAAFQSGDWAQGIDGPFDLLLINPPYIASATPLSGDVLHEPDSALFAGADGLDDYRRIIPDLPRLIAPGGMAAIEIGHDQRASVTTLLRETGLMVRALQDLAGHDRCLVATLA